MLNIYYISDFLSLDTLCTIYLMPLFSAFDAFSGFLLSQSSVMNAPIGVMPYLLVKSIKE